MNTELQNKTSEVSVKTFSLKMLKNVWMVVPKKGRNKEASMQG